MLYSSQQRKALHDENGVLNIKREKIGIEHLLEYLEELIACDALELVRNSESNPENIYIPYMMNDAVEYYLILKECKVTGNMPDRIPEGVSVQSAEKDSPKGIIFGLPDGSRISLWFVECEIIIELYQYHQIGHFWMKGQEQWRQLVYMIGTIFDKYTYIGETACNAEERELLPLITFAPFRYWSPVHEDLESRYPDAVAGIQCMQKLAQEAGDRAYKRMTGVYLFLFRLRIFPMGFLTRMLARELNMPARTALYELIYCKVCKASVQYQERDYGETLNKIIREKRSRVEQELNMQGFSGEYPLFQKENEMILATEEHPFTVLESEDFSFRIQLMVSKMKDAKPALNAGFFDGNDRSGTIVEVK